MNRQDNLVGFVVKVNADFLNENAREPMLRSTRAAFRMVAPKNVVISSLAALCWEVEGLQQN